MDGLSVSWCHMDDLPSIFQPTIPVGWDSLYYSGCRLQNAYYSLYRLQKSLLFRVVAKNPNILGSCKKDYYSGWLQKDLLFRVVAKNAYYSGWLQKSLLFRVVAEKAYYSGRSQKVNYPG
jgi:hypothetical protein